jgi:hypothetical protein
LSTTAPAVTGSSRKENSVSKKNDDGGVDVHDLEKNFRRRAKMHRMGGRESKNVISIRPEPPDDDTSPMSLRDVMLLTLETVATIFNRAPPQAPPDQYTRGMMSGLICALADARMPFNTWKDEISDEALAGLRRMKVNLRPELSAAFDEVAISIALERHPPQPAT